MAVASQRISVHSPAKLAERTASWASSPAARRVMQGNKRRDTGPELAVRRAVHARRLRYRVASRPLSGCRWTADLVFAGARVAVFIDGCFWHGCLEHVKPPSTNAHYRRSKIDRNQVRDANVDAALREAGWRPLRFWEHDEPEAIAEEIVAAVRGKRAL